jgi:argininosuccinate lyase
VKTSLQWGGRFIGAPDPALLAFGSSLEDDFVLAPFDALVSRAHVAALRDGAVITSAQADALDAALVRVQLEIENGSFASYARTHQFEDIHGAIDARVREFQA